MKKTRILLFIVLSGLMVSCTEWLTVQPEEVLSEDEMFQSKDGFYDALYGVYSRLDNYDHNGGLVSTTIEHMAAQWEVKVSSTEEKIRNHLYSSVKQPFSSVFRNQYNAIANINNILKYLEIQDFLVERDYNQIKGECLGLRAWLHFDLIRLWGPIPGKVNFGREYLPYVTEFTYQRHEYYVYNEYMQLLADDINAAEELLADIPVEDNYTLNHIGILALQARLNLWQENKEMALEYANKVIDYVNSEENELYAFATLDNIGVGDFLFKKEHLFGIYDNFSTVAFLNTLYNTTSYLLELYEYSTSDIRFQLWEDRDEDGLNEPAMDLLKYTSSEGSIPIIRLPEIYFIAMECSDLDKANELYATFCQSRGVSFTEIATKDQLESVLYSEYRKEFIAEGVLFYYYKRHYALRIPRNPNVCTEQSYVLSLPEKEVDVNF